MLGLTRRGPRLPAPPADPSLSDQAKSLFGPLSEAETDIFRRIETNPTPPPLLPPPTADAAGGDDDEPSSRTIAARSKTITRRVGKIPDPAEPSAVRTEFGPRLAQHDLTRRVRTALLRWLCRHEAAPRVLAGATLTVRDAWFDARLGLARLDLPVPLAFEQCWLPYGLDLLDAKLPSLALDGSRVGPLVAARSLEPEAPAILHAEGLRADGMVSLRDGTCVLGEVNLLAADLGHLTCSNSVFDNPGGRALTLDRATIRGDVYLRRQFQANGQIRFLFAKINGNLDCRSAHLANPGGEPLVLDGAEIDGSVLLRTDSTRRFAASGTVRLVGCSIGDTLDCVGADFDAGADLALQAERARIGGSVFLGVDYRTALEPWDPARDAWGFTAKGTVRLFGATISGSLICHRARLINPSGITLDLEAAHVSGSVLPRLGFLSVGRVNLFGTVIDGDLECRQARFVAGPPGPGETATALRVARSRIGRSANLSHPFHARGGVIFEDSGVGGDLNLDGADFSLDTGGTHCVSPSPR